MEIPIFRIFSLLVLLVFVNGEDNIDDYYLDSLGHICTDTIDTIQKVEYDSQIHCTVSPMMVCDDDEPIDNSLLRRRIGQQPSVHSDEDLLVEGNDPIGAFQHRAQPRARAEGGSKQVCHTMSVKECKTVNIPKESKVKKSSKLTYICNK